MIANLLLSLTVNQSDCLIQRLNLCYNLSNFRCFDTAAEKLDEMWMGRPACLLQLWWLQPWGAMASGKL